jgi:hypothetical protein
MFVVQPEQHSLKQDTNQVLCHAPAIVDVCKESL